MASFKLHNLEMRGILQYISPCGSTCVSQGRDVGAPRNRSCDGSSCPQLDGLLQVQMRRKAGVVDGPARRPVDV